MKQKLSCRVQPGSTEHLGQPSPFFFRGSVFLKGHRFRTLPSNGCHPFQALVPWKLLGSYFSNNPVLERWLCLTIPSSWCSSLIPTLPQAGLIAKTVGEISLPLKFTQQDSDPEQGNFLTKVCYMVRDKTFLRRRLQEKFFFKEWEERQRFLFIDFFANEKTLKNHFLAAALRCISC